MTTEEYEAKRKAKAERFRELAEKHKEQSTERYTQYRRNLELVPLGQPILIGHHSEAGHRAHLKRIDNHMRKSIEHDEKAKYYERRAEAVDSNQAIFSDDPNATEKLTEKTQQLEERQKLMREANKLVRKKDTEGLLNMGFTEAQIQRLCTPDFCGRVGFADYRLTNNNANIRRLKQRLTQLEQVSTQENTENTINGVRIVENVDENRLQLFFPSIPSQEVRAKLKHAGFRWSPTNQAWQRHRSNAATYQANDIVNSIPPEANQ